MTALKKTYPQTTPPEQSSTAPAGRRWPAGPPWSTAYLGDFPVASPVLVLVVHSGACGCCLQCVHPHTRSVWSVWCTRTTEPLALSAAASLMKLACSIGANNFTTPSLQNPSVLSPRRPHAVWQRSRRPQDVAGHDDRGTSCNL